MHKNTGQHDERYETSEEGFERLLLVVGLCLAAMLRVHQVTLRRCFQRVGSLVANPPLHHRDLARHPGALALAHPGALALAHLGALALARPRRPLAELLHLFNQKSKLW